MFSLCVVLMQWMVLVVWVLLMLVSIGIWLVEMCSVVLVIFSFFFSDRVLVLFSELLVMMLLMLFWIRNLQWCFIVGMLSVLLVVNLVVMVGKMLVQWGRVVVVMKFLYVVNIFIVYLSVVVLVRVYLGLNVGDGVVCVYGFVIFVGYNLLFNCVWVVVQVCVYF